MKPKVYVAGPYTNGDVAVNVANAIFAGNILLEEGCAPYIPHLAHFWHMLHPHPYEAWFELDEAWLPVCEAVVILPGLFPGALKETIQARSLGIPVYHVAEPLHDSLVEIARRVRDEEA